MNLHGQAQTNVKQKAVNAFYHLKYRLLICYVTFLELWILPITPKFILNELLELLFKL